MTDCKKDKGKSPIMSQDHMNGRSIFIDCSSSDPCQRQEIDKNRQKSSPMATLKVFLPVLGWLPNYKGGHLAQDLIAGVTVGLMVIPQGIAYGFLAGLPPQYGLYSAFLPGFVYMVFGTSSKVTIGPVALLAVMVAPYAESDPSYAVLLALITGIVITICGLLKLGFVVDFFSAPVTSGFVSAASIVIASNQLKALLGITGKLQSEFPGLLGICHRTYLNFDTAKWQDIVLSITCIAILLALRSAKDLVCLKRRQSLSKAVWLASITRNALVVLSSAALAYLLGKDAFVLTGRIDAGPVAPQLPKFSANYTSDNGEAVNDDLPQMLRNMGTLSILLPLVAVMQHVAIAKAFCSKKSLDANQELLALGIVNLLGAFVGSMPVTASFGRTAVNSSSGAKTPLGGVVTGFLVLMTLAFLLPYCAFIPKATLGAVIVCAVVFSIDLQMIATLWRSKKYELIPFLVTFLCCLFWALDYGVLVGIAVSLIFPLADIARPTINITRKRWRSLNGDDELSVTWLSPDRSIFFPGVASFKQQLADVIAGNNTKGTDRGGDGKNKDEDDAAPALPTVNVLDCTYAQSLDFTAAEAIKEILKDYSDTVLYNVSSSGVHTISKLTPNGKGATKCAASVGELQDILEDTIKQK